MPRQGQPSGLNLAISADIEFLRCPSSIRLKCSLGSSVAEIGMSSFQTSKLFPRTSACLDRKALSETLSLFPST